MVNTNGWGDKNKSINSIRPLVFLLVKSNQEHVKKLMN